MGWIVAEVNLVFVTKLCDSEGRLCPLILVVIEDSKVHCLISCHPHLGQVVGKALETNQLKASS